MALLVNEKAVRGRMVEKGIYFLEELSRRSGVTADTMRRMFTGKSFESSSIAAMADALECSPMDLMTVVGEPENGKGAA